MTELTSATQDLLMDLVQTESETKRRRALAKSITLIESTKPAHQAQAQALLSKVLPYSGKTKRIGISGTPGVGKSTFIEAFGLFLVNQGLTVAVLAVDPSSPLRGGSILGDKTRMERLARAEGAFIRPSPSAGALGGVAQKTRESMLLCEAANFDIILVETVGVGQSEYEVASMVDFFMVLMQPNSGDELQGIKRGIMELADALVINKADGDSLNQAERTKQHCQNALHLMHTDNAWHPQALTCSAQENRNIDAIWEMLERYFSSRQNEIQSQRAKQNEKWLNSLISEQLKQLFESSDAVKAALPRLRADVIKGKLTAFDAAQTLMNAFRD